ncbi:MAG: hypothetical protein ACR2JC_12225 [Chloroflexota bacterium]|nr:MAG: hypothetical protein DLM70_16190 [Chloroflexota bacterium]
MNKRNARLWAGRVSKAFFTLMLLAFGMSVVALALSGTVYRSRPGCEECSPHIDWLLGGFFGLAVSLLLCVAGIAFAVAAAERGRRN